ncbi:MAG: C40 family peptidase [Lachnospiraceae bacterium]|nr:C40 family peptidase [Lachnospiraceae bacterium]
MSRKRFRILCAILSVILMFNAGVFTGNATPADDLNRANQNINNLNNQLNQVNQNINNISNQRNQTKQEADELNAQIVDLMASISIAEKDLANKQAQLNKVQGELEETQKKIAEQTEAMRARIKSIYERGNNAYLTVFLESKNFADLVNKMEYASTIYEYDKTMLESLKESKKKAEELEVQVEGEKLSLESSVQELNQEKALLNSKLATLKATISDYDTQIANAKKQAEEYKNKIEEENKKAAAAQAAAAAEAANKNKGSSSASNENGGSGGGSNSGGGESGGGSGGGSSNVSYNASLGAQIVAEAKKYVGNKYVWGGNDLNNGIDCSGFTQQIYGKFGISLPRWSGDQRNCGTAVSLSAAKPGDLVCYAGHVAIYMGNDTIIHASNSAPYPQGGIKISSPATYATILSVRRLCT